MSAAPLYVHSFGALMHIKTHSYRYRVSARQRARGTCARQTLSLTVFPAARTDQTKLTSELER